MFQSTPPARAATVAITNGSQVMLFQSTPPARAATERHLPACTAGSVSIHAARAGGDFRSSQPPTGQGVSIHAARAGGDDNPMVDMMRDELFQSTPPARAATTACFVVAGSCLFQSTPPARAATGYNAAARPGWRVSIHAARAGGDTLSWSIGSSYFCFNPRRPRGRRRVHHGRGQRHDAVSIHAARAGGDQGGATSRDWSTCFNPRRPRGRRQLDALLHAQHFTFQSTPPARAATGADRDDAGADLVSIHAARAGGDQTWARTSCASHRFNSRRPRGRRRRPDDSATPPAGVSIHAARAGGDAPRGTRSARSLRFNPRRPRGRRPGLPGSYFNLMYKFQSTPPARAATSPCH